MFPVRESILHPHYSSMAAIASGRVPDRRGIGPVLNRHRDLLGHRNPVPLRVVGRPSRGGDLDDAHVVEGALFRIEVGILPVGHQHDVPDGVGVARVCHVHRAADFAFTATMADGQHKQQDPSEWDKMILGDAEVDAVVNLDAPHRTPMPSR